MQRSHQYHVWVQCNGGPGGFQQDLRAGKPLPPPLLVLYNQPPYTTESKFWVQQWLANMLRNESHASCCQSGCRPPSHRDVKLMMHVSLRQLTPIRWSVPTPR